LTCFLPVLVVCFILLFVLFLVKYSNITCFFLGDRPLIAPVTDDPELDRMTQEELNAMHLHGSDAPPQWEVHGIGLPGTRAQPIRGRWETVESRAGMSADQLQLPEVAHSNVAANTTY
jgi:hypothetical protein